MCSDNQIVVAWVNENVIDADARQSRHEFFPFVTAIKRNVKPELSSRIEQVFIFEIFTNHIDSAPAGQVVGDAGPGGAVIASDVQVWLEIIEAMTIDRQIAGTRVKVRRLNARDVVQLAGFLGKDRYVLRDIGPIHAAVATYLHVAVVSPGPKDAWHHWRFPNCDYITVAGVAVIL